jgi:TonB family protein
MDSVHAESVFPATDASDVPRTTTSPGLAAAATEGHVLPDGLPQEQSRPIAASAGQIDPCQLIHSVQPVYPREARRLHVEGDVELRVVVGVDGMVTSVGLVSGPPLLVPAAMAAARGFRYKSASLNGQPIETVQTIDMSFKLKN